MNRNDNLCPGLLLADRQHSITNMLRPHAHDIAAALPSIEAQIESEPLRCPHRPAGLKVLYVGLLPRSEALRGCPYIPHANSRVFVSETYIDRMASRMRNIISRLLAADGVWAFCSIRARICWGRRPVIDLSPCACRKRSMMPR